MKTNSILFLLIGLTAFNFPLMGQSSVDSQVGDFSKELRVVRDLTGLLALKEKPLESKTYALVRIVPGPDQTNIPNKRDTYTGTLEFLDSSILDKPIKSVFYSIPINHTGYSQGVEDDEFSAYNWRKQSFAICQVVPAILDASGKAVKYPKTFILPDDWAVAAGKMLAVPSITDFFALRKVMPADGHFATQLDLLIYGNELANRDFSRFKNEYGTLLAAGDICVNGYFTYLLLQNGKNFKQDASYEARLEANFAADNHEPTQVNKDALGNVREKLARELGQSDRPGGSMGKTDLKTAADMNTAIWTKINNTIESNITNPKIIIPIALGIYASLTLDTATEDKDPASKALALIKSKVKTDSPEWTNNASFIKSME